MASTEEPACQSGSSTSSPQTAVAASPAEKTGVEKTPADPASSPTDNVDRISTGNGNSNDTNEKSHGQEDGGKPTDRSPRAASTANLVQFSCSDPEDPKNWPKNRKLAAILMTSVVCFLTPATSSMVAPALQTISDDLQIVDAIEQQLILSIFVLGMGVGPLLFGPLSEIHGRSLVLRYGNLFYLAFNGACGFARNESEMLAFRFLSGLGGAAPIVIGSGLISDCYRPEERGYAVAMYNIAPLLGPSLGPILGAFVTQYISWRWLFFGVSIVDIFVQVVMFFCLRESYAPVLLERRRRALIKSTGNAHLRTRYTEELDQRSFGAMLRISLLRCLHMLATEPILQVLAVYSAYVYGLIYLAYSTFPILWTQVHRESIAVGSLNYLSLGVGYISGSLLCGVLVDRIYLALRARHDGTDQPEYRVPSMVLASLFVPIGLCWYGWSAQGDVHWIVPNAGACIFSMGVIIIMQCVNTYAIDAYPRFSASAVSAVTLVRNIPGTVFPLFAPYMYNRLGFGWGNTVLALAAVCIGIPAPILIWKFGRRLRRVSQYARP